MNELLVRTLCVLGVLVGLAMVVIGLPGTFVIVAVAGVYGWTTSFQAFSPPFLLLLLALSVFAEVADNLIGVAWARRTGSTIRGMIGSIVGAIAGATIGSGVLPIIGTLVGGLVGCFAGAFLFEYYGLRDHRKAAKAGWGAVAGRAVGIALKMVIGLVMSILFLWRVFGG